jgi:hypothetical protein
MAIYTAIHTQTNNQKSRVVILKAEELETVGSFNKELAINFMADIIIF